MGSIDCFGSLAVGHTRSHKLLQSASSGQPPHALRCPNNPSTKPIHGTNHSDKPAGVSLALRCPSGLNANQSIEDTLKFKIAK